MFSCLKRQLPLFIMISYQSEGVKMPRFPHRPCNDWIRRVAIKYGRVVGNITYIFCNDEKILDINRQFLHHDYYTDIITFDYTQGLRISGDLFISLDTVRSNADQLGLPYEQELRRVIIHGILHLCGLNDKAPGEREIMEQAENEALDMWSAT